jgi:hypothetical protein
MGDTCHVERRAAGAMASTVPYIPGTRKLEIYLRKKVFYSLFVESELC